MATRLAELVSTKYPPAQYPAVHAQITTWRQERPLAGVRILDCTPLFSNTLAKFLPLQVAGAKLTVGLHREIPADPAVVAQLPELGIEVLRKAANDETRPVDQHFDVVLDCAGRHCAIASTRGYAELTHSGLSAYEGTTRPVVMLDHSPLKLLETMFGTGESFVRALDHLDVTPGSGHLVIFGAGKVGSGIALNSMNRGLDVTVVDVPTAANYAQAPLIDVRDAAAVGTAIQNAGIIVTATGAPSAVAGFAAEITNSPAILANMGVDDEFGPAVPTVRVLNNKAPVNFALAEPTLMRFMDPVFALSNAAAVDLCRGVVEDGIHAPRTEVEVDIANAMRSNGVNVAELAIIEELIGRRF